MRLTLLLMLVSAASGCASVPAPTLKMLPPVELIQECPHPVVSTNTNGDLARGILAYRESLTLCNNDKAALREWSDKESK